MKLDRNLKENYGRGKYALLKLRDLRIDPLRTIRPSYEEEEIEAAIKTLDKFKLLDWGGTPETEFFVMRLKDLFALDGLIAYSKAATKVDPEYGKEVFELALRSGPNSPFCKIPD